MRRLIALVLVALVPAGACGGDDDKESATGGARASTTTAAPTTTAGLSSSAASTPPAPGSTATAVGARTGSTTATTTAGGASSTPAPGLTFTAPGAYRYASTGRFTSTLTGAQPRDGETVLTVDPPAGADQHSVRQGGGRRTDQVLRLEGGSALLVSLRQSEQGLTKEFRPSPPGLAIPGDTAPGRAWSWRATSTDGQTNVDSSFRVVRTEEVTVGAEQVGAVVIELVLTLSGDVVSTSRQTLWVSPRHGLVVRQDEDTQGRFGALAFSSTSSDKLISLRPA